VPGLARGRLEAERDALRRIACLHQPADGPCSYRADGVPDDDEPAPLTLAEAMGTAEATSDATPICIGCHQRPATHGADCVDCWAEPIGSFGD
jgi:hypothetical protein